MSKIVFKKISELLTGFDELPDYLLEQYLERISNADGYKDALGHLTEIVPTNISTLTLSDVLNIEIDTRLYKGITFLWYTSELVLWDRLNDDLETFKKTLDNRIAGLPTEYYGALIWKAIQAHPAGLSGGYYGYWKYEPEN